MIRRIITWILRLTLRVYFRRIEVTGREHIPTKSPVIFVLNHPNALVDPAFLLCLTPRKIAFIGKAPIFRMPVIGYVARALDTIPAYRREDEAEDAGRASRNLETFAAARKLLKRGIAIGICPEGLSHNEPRLRPLKTGAARIAIAATSSGDAIDLKIVPVGLYYTDKTTFRSSALLHFGEPIAVMPAVLEADGSPPRPEVRELSNAIEQGMREVMLHAEQEEALGLIDRAEKIFSAEEVDEPGEKQGLARSLQLRQRFVARYADLRKYAPARLDAIESRIARFEQELDQTGMDPSDLSLPPTATNSIVRLLAQIGTCVLMAPLALVGAAVHYPAYRLGGFLARRMGRDQDVLSTFKIISAMLLFPLTWIVVALIGWRALGWMAGLLLLLMLPFCGYLAVRFFEEIDRFFGSFMALAMFVMRRRFFVRLLAERAAIRREILALGEDAPIQSG